MKKLLYIIALVTTLTVSITACTDENVQPTTQEGGGQSGAVSDNKG